jgi:hypothetical protein
VYAVSGTSRCLFSDKYKTHKVLICDIPVVYKNVNNKRGEQSKHNDAVVSSYKQTTCFGPCTGPSSGLNLRVGGYHTVRIFSQKLVLYRVNEILLFCGTVMFVKL